jgi:hypothetical protein
LAVGSFYFAPALTNSTLAWTAALIALDALAFVWSFTRFRRET